MDKQKVRKKPRLSHRKRFHLLYEWLTLNYKPCKAADVGGGKGLLAYLLNTQGWDVTVIDPFHQTLPKTFKDLHKHRTTLKPEERSTVKRITAPFHEEMVKDYDLLIALHAHGSNIKIIDGCAKYNKNFAIMPCYVVGEPIEVKPDINWIDSLEEYARSKGFYVNREVLNFKGQNIILYNL